MPGTRYDRFLDVHLVSSNVKNQADILANQIGNYEYGFKGDSGNQQRAYAAKLDQEFLNDPAYRRQLLGAQYLGGMIPQAQTTQTLAIHHVLGSQGAALPMQNLEPLHYVTCYVDLESLQPGQPVIFELAALVEWVCAAQSRAGGPTKGKLRLNCHGSSTANAGFIMGNSNLPVDDFVDALIRHGLGTRVKKYGSKRQNLVDEQAQWKADEGVTNCENEACKNKNKPFSMFRRKHHCRRCGGIFCDDCTQKRRTLRNPLTKEGRASGTVADCRVCDDCASKAETIQLIADVKARTGLAQITLAMCCTARSEREFATAKTGFARNSTAARFVARLSTQGVHGIQVSGSNEVLKGTATQTFSVKYPGISRKRKPSAEPAYDPFEGTGWAGADIKESSLEIPCSILGSRGEPDPDPQYPSIMGNAMFARVRDQRIIPIQGGNKMAFGIFNPGKPDGEQVEKALLRWSFTSWRQIQEPVGRIAELTRVAGELADQGAKESQTAFFTQSAIGASARRTALATAAAFTNSAPRSGPQATIVIDAPLRRVTIRRNPKDPNSLIVSGLEERRFKDFKVYQVS